MLSFYKIGVTLLETQQAHPENLLLPPVNQPHYLLQAIAIFIVFIIITIVTTIFILTCKSIKRKIQNPIENGIYRAWLTISSIWLFIIAIRYIYVSQLDDPYVSEIYWVSSSSVVYLLYAAMPILVGCLGGWIIKGFRKNKIINNQ